MPETESIAGMVEMHAAIVQPTHALRLDLDAPLVVNRVTAGEGGALTPGTALEIERELLHFRIKLGRTLQPGENVVIRVEYEGQPRVAPNPPWDGGFTWASTADGRPWIAVSCQGDGADVWWPVKDHVSDRPDSLRVVFTIPEELELASNGVRQSVTRAEEGTRRHEWFVSTPISVYNVTFVAGPLELIETTYASEAGHDVPVQFFVLPERRADAERILPHFLDQVRFMERTFGPFPFRADKYGVVHAPYLGMEHQTMLAYGADFRLNRFGFEWLHFHELAHEWWGNLVTATDWRDFWIHEGFAIYSEALYAEHLAAERGDNPAAAYHDYMGTARAHIQNILPISPVEPRTTTQITRLPGGGRTNDIYYKGAWVLHGLRFLADNDEAFVHALRRITYETPEMELVSDGSHMRHVTTTDVLRSFEIHAGIPRHRLEAVAAVYLRQPHLPRLEVEEEGGEVIVRWVVPEESLAEGQAFEIPVEVHDGRTLRRIDMTGGEGRFTPSGAYHIDPRRWLLREE